jgi:DNA-binding CsgD family transcriptional regulator
VQTTTGGAFVADSLRDARVAIRSAWYDAALQLLQGCEDWPLDLAEAAVVLKAEVLGRRDPVEAARYLASVEDIPSSVQGRFDFAIQSGKAHAAVRAFSQAEGRYAEARALASEVPNGIHTMAYHDVRMRWYRRDCDPHADDVQLAISHPDPSIACAAYNFRAFMHAGRGDYAAHVADLCRSVEYATMPSPEQVDVATLAVSINALAQVAFETANSEAISVVRTAVEALPWTDDVKVYRFLTVRALGWDAFMRGRIAEAQWSFKEARGLAPTTPWRVMAHLDRAYVARLSHNEFWAAEELAQADALAYDVRWEATHGEERQVLILLAYLHAPTDAPRAQSYASAYAQLGTESVDPGLAIHRDPRALAHAKYASARIEQMLGHKAMAETLLREAYEIFEEVGFRYRATVSATALAEVTGDDAWRQAAMRQAAYYPDCPMARMADDSIRTEEAMPAQLSPLQRQIARATWSGADPRELSRRFSRSVFRIERQIEAVFSAFGVRTRTELFDEARRRGLA